MRALVMLAFCALCSGCVDRVLCPKGVNKVEWVWIGETIGTQDIPVYLWPGDTVFIGAGAGVDPSEEFCPQNENMYQSENSPDKFTWGSTDSAVATMLPVGAIVAKQEGSTSISVKVGNRTAYPRDVKVVPALSALRLIISPLQPKPGETVTVTVEGIGLNGELVSSPAIKPMTSDRVSGNDWLQGSGSRLQNSFIAKAGVYHISVEARRSGKAPFIGTSLVIVQ